jgi:hypothetical protein
MICTMPSSTHIHFIRDPSATAQTTDDRVTIQRTGVDHYELTYTTTMTDTGTANNYTIRTDGDNIFRWFRSIIALLEADAAPFPQIQVDFPAAPSILIYTRHIHRHYHTLLDALEFWLDDGELSTPPEGPPKTPPRQPTHPVEPNAPERPVLRSHHMFFDLGDD